MSKELTALQRSVLEACLARQTACNLVNVASAVADTSQRTTYVLQAFKHLRAKGYLIQIDASLYRVVRDQAGTEINRRTHRRVAEDGVTVTQCPPAYAKGYGFDRRDLTSHIGGSSPWP